MNILTRSKRSWIKQLHSSLCKKERETRKVTNLNTYLLLPSLIEQQLYIIFREGAAAIGELPVEEVGLGRLFRSRPEFSAK